MDELVCLRSPDAYDQEENSNEIFHPFHRRRARLVERLCRRRTRHPVHGPEKAPLAAGDKKFVKDQTEGLYFVMELIGQSKTNAQTEPVKKLGEKAKADFDKVWGDVAGFATNNMEELPKELKGADKSAAERLKKADKKNWDKEFLKTTGKEVKKMARAFKDAKTLVSPDLKKIATDWGPIMSKL
jgi:hypothetical protein